MADDYDSGARGGGGRGNRGSRGRGWYYREKYGGRGSRGRGGGRYEVDSYPRHPVSAAASPLPPSLSSSSSRPPSASSMWPVNLLAAALHDMDRESYGRLKSIKGTYAFSDGAGLFIDSVQSDPFAPPSRLRVRVPMNVAEFPSDLFQNKSRKVALEDYLTRAFWNYIHTHRLDVANVGSGWHASKGADINIDKPGQQVLERSAMLITPDFVEARFTVALPAQGRSILGRQTADLLTAQVPAAVAATLRHAAHDAAALRAFVLCIEDQDALRAALRSAACIAFVPDGAILPRAAGDSDLPMQGARVVPFVAPPELRREFVLPNRGVVAGM
ncbi:hypothetical protein HK405_007313, partial [Cladochytrium tenue]